MTKTALMDGRLEAGLAKMDNGGSSYNADVRPTRLTRTTKARYEWFVFEEKSSPEICRLSNNISSLRATSMGNK
jgi:hypothetical protein